jgi:hypothetical protein
VVDWYFPIWVCCTKENLATLEEANLGSFCIQLLHFFRFGIHVGTKKNLATLGKMLAQWKSDFKECAGKGGGG